MNNIKTDNGYQVSITYYKRESPSEFRDRLIKYKTDLEKEQYLNEKRAGDYRQSIKLYNDKIDIYRLELLEDKMNYIRNKIEMIDNTLI